MSNKRPLPSKSKRLSSKPLKIGYGKTPTGVMTCVKSTMFGLTLSVPVSMTAAI